MEKFEEGHGEFDWKSRGETSKKKKKIDIVDRVHFLSGKSPPSCLNNCIKVYQLLKHYILKSEEYNHGLKINLLYFNHYAG